MTRFTRILAALLVAATLTLAGCGGGGDGGSTVASSAFTPVELTNPTPTGGAFSAGVGISDTGLAVGFADDGISLKGAKWLIPPGQDPVPGEVLAPLAGNSYSAAYGVNLAGLTVGESGTTLVIPDDSSVAVYWPADGTSPVALSTTGLFAGGASAAFAISPDDQIVGEAVADADGNTAAVVWDSPTADPVILANLPGGSFSSAYPLGAEGRIVGEAQDDTGQIRAVTWLPLEGGGYDAPLALDSVPEQVAGVAFSVDFSGRIVGEVELLSGVNQGVLWDFDGSLVATLGDDTSAQAISDGNRIVGYAGAHSGSDFAMLWNGANFNDNKTLEVPFSQAYGLNNSNTVVGVSGNQAFAAVRQ